MKKHLLALAVTLAATGSVWAQASDTLAKIKSSGTVTLGVRESSGLGYTLGNGKYVGFHTEMGERVLADIQKQLGLAKLDIKYQPVTSQNRIPLLQSGKADLIVADITITPERAQVIDFSTPYFVTGQQFLVPAGSPDKLDEYSKARIGAVKGTTGEQALHQRFPQSRVLSYDDIPLALTALRNGNVQAITQDSTILAGLLAEAPDKANFKIIPDLLSKEEIGVGVKKGEPALLKAVNDELVNLEKSGQAAKIYDVWFGPATKTPQPRAFTIEAK